MGRYVTEDDRRAAWLEDIIAGLLINGVAGPDINIWEDSDGDTIVAVRGEIKYRWLAQNPHDKGR